jgi:hypothetical protein
LLLVAEAELEVFVAFTGAKVAVVVKFSPATRSHLLQMLQLQLMLVQVHRAQVIAQKPLDLMVRIQY